jgi:hypothetical protein
VKIDEIPCRSGLECLPKRNDLYSERNESFPRMVTYFPISHGEYNNYSPFHNRMRLLKK